MTTSTTSSISPMAGRLVMEFLNKDTAWDTAIDCVDYPIYVKSLHFHHNGDELPAAGKTNTNRDSQFFGVVVDRNRTDELSTIATVTNTYGAIPPAEVYDSLRSELDSLGIDCTPKHLYVSGDGGRQILSIKIEGQKAPNCRDNIGMMVQLITSIDGTKKHTMRLVAFDYTNNVELVGLTNEQFNVSTRHTQAIKDRHIIFEGILTRLISEWNDTIMPMMAIMMDAKFSRTTALGLLQKLLKDADIPKRHQEKAESAFQGKYADSTHEHSVYSVMSNVSEYLSTSLADKPERAEDFREKLNKRAHKTINKVLKDMGLETL